MEQHEHPHNTLEIELTATPTTHLDVIIPKKTRVTSTSALDIQRQEERLEWMKKEKEVERLQIEVESVEGKIQELESAAEQVVGDLEPLEKGLAEFATQHDFASAELLNAECQLQEMREKFLQTSAKLDQVTVYRGEVDVARLKADLFEIKIEISVLEEKIGDLKSRINEIYKALTDAREELYNKEIEVLQMATLFEEDHRTWIQKWANHVKVAEENCASTSWNADAINLPLVTVDSADNAVMATKDAELEALKARFKEAEQQILDKDKKIEALQTSAAEAVAQGDITSAGGRSVESVDNDHLSSMSDLKKENMLLKQRLELTEHLWKIGLFTRASKLDKEKPGRTNPAITWHGMESFKSANILADASMFLVEHPEKRVAASDFLNAYKVTPSVVWQNRHFKKFLQMLEWKVNMNTRYKFHNSTAFNENFEKLFKAIYPRFEVKTDAELQSNPELRNAFEVLEKEHEEARRVDRNGGGRVPRVVANGVSGKQIENVKV